uniref:Uncharacterized protein n=1 Tax=Arundo donax TaxID=35708 RepID=A0A0A9HIG6_ARUDO
MPCGLLLLQASSGDGAVSDEISRRSCARYVRYVCVCMLHLGGILSPDVCVRVVGRVFWAFSSGEPAGVGASDWFSLRIPAMKLPMFVQQFTCGLACLSRWLLRLSKAWASALAPVKEQGVASPGVVEFCSTALEAAMEGEEKEDCREDLQGLCCNFCSCEGSSCKMGMYFTDI